jgi:predicted amidohydrolase
MFKPICEEICEKRFLLWLFPLTAIVALGIASSGRMPAPVRAEGKSPDSRKQQDNATASTAGVPATHRGEQNDRVGVAALVLPNVRGNKSLAVERIENYVRRAAALGAKIVVTPETCLDGYVCHQQGLTHEKFCELAEQETGPRIARLREVARELDLYLCVGFSELESTQLYNTALLIGPDGETVGKYRKTHGVEPLYEIGDELPVFETRYGKVGILICFDRQLPETARSLAAQGAELILIPSNGMWGRMNDALLRTRAYENGLFLVFAHPRDGLVIDPGGRVLAANMSVPGQGVGLPTNTDTQDAGGWPEAVVREIDLAAWRQARGNLSNRRPQLYDHPQASTARQ